LDRVTVLSKICVATRATRGRFTRVGLYCTGSDAGARLELGHPNKTRRSSRKAIKTQVSTAVTKYNEFIRRRGWYGEIEKPERNGTISIDGCPLAQHLCKRFVLDGDIDTACTIHHDLLVDLLQRLEEFDWIQVNRSSTGWRTCPR